LGCASRGCSRSRVVAIETGTILGDIYSWSTEGFDTADHLKEAKTLLDHLSI
jgi:hypothetical protein